MHRISFPFYCQIFPAVDVVVRWCGTDLGITFDLRILDAVMIMSYSNIKGGQKVQSDIYDIHAYMIFIHMFAVIFMMHSPTNYLDTFFHADIYVCRSRLQTIWQPQVHHTFQHLHLEGDFGAPDQTAEFPIRHLSGCG